MNKICTSQHSQRPANKEKSASTAINDIESLTSHNLVNSSYHEKLTRVSERFAVAITPPMLDLIEPNNPFDPIALQFVPDIRELESGTTDLHDPIGDQKHSPVKGIVHRYPDRLLLTPIQVCPVYCRFCFRRETVSQPDHALLSKAELQSALNYIREHQDVWEVILSGGDPFLLSPRRLREIVAVLDEIEHVRVIRVHTRVPVVDPQRISASLVDALASNKAVYVVLHSNHPRELTPSALAACKKIIDAGIPMLSQTVLLKDVNDNAAILEELFRDLVANRIKPYYLHHGDRATGTEHFRTRVSHGQDIVRQLRGKVSGLCQPTYVLDIPGGAGKVPLEPAWAETMDKQHYKITDRFGVQHNYIDI